MVAKLKKVADLATFLPLYLEGSAFEVYDQMAERDKEAATEIEKTLLQAFALSTFKAYEEFRGDPRYRERQLTSTWRTCGGWHVWRTWKGTNY